MDASYLNMSFKVTSYTNLIVNWRLFTTQTDFCFLSLWGKRGGSARHPELGNSLLRDVRPAAPTHGRTWEPVSAARGRRGHGLRQRRPIRTHQQDVSTLMGHSDMQCSSLVDGSTVL